MKESNNLLNTIPGQMLRRIEQDGVCYNVVIVGEGYSGKTSLINSLFGADITGEPCDELFQEVCDMVCTDNPLGDLIGEKKPTCALEKMKVTVVATKIRLVEEGGAMNLTVYEVSGVGDTVDKQQEWIAIRNLVLNRYEEYHIEEESGDRANDKRIHCCLYISTPRSTPREVDIEAMKEIGKITNLIPIISKSDSVSPKEYKDMKESFFSWLMVNKVPLFDSILVDECRKVVELSFMPLRYSTPGRKYAYSEAAGEVDAGVSDLAVLRDLLIKSHAVDAIEMVEKFYENYRRNKLIVEALMTSEHGVNADFKRSVSLEEVKLRTLAKRIEEKRKNYNALMLQQSERGKDQVR